MTKNEAVIISAYTSYLLVPFSDVHEYIEKKMGRPVWTHEMGDPEFYEKIREACRSDFLGIKIMESSHD
jgi:hypothetical protein